jgi:hypothetical protein
LTCYFRHLTLVFQEAGITVTLENKKDVDHIIHQLVGVEYKDCSETWRQIKQRLADNHDEFVAELKNAWQHRA